MAVEITIKEKMKALYSLQKVDSDLDQIEVLKGELPMEVRDLEDEINGMRTRIGKLESSADEHKSVMNRHEGNIADSQTMMERYNQQLDNVKNNREFDALTKEIELQKLEIILSEKKINEIKSKVSTLDESITEVKAKLEIKEKDIVDKRVALEKIIEKTVKDQEKLERKSGRARKKIDERLLKAYDKIRGSYRNKLAVVSVERNSCGGCFNKIPPQIQLEVKLLNKIQICEHCGRLLIDEEYLDK